MGGAKHLLWIRGRLIELWDQGLRISERDGNAQAIFSLCVRLSLRYYNCLISSCPKNLLLSAVICDQIVKGAIKPDEFELQVLVKMDSGVGNIIAKTSTEAQLQVKIAWKTKENL